MSDRSEVDVSIVIVSYNTADLLARCLSSLQGSTSEVVEIIVVDNASVDGSVEVVRSSFPSVRVVELPVNVGFAAGVNRGAEAAKGRYLLLLNPDAAMHEGTLAELVRFADRHPRNGIYGGRILSDEGTSDPRSCWGLPSAWSLFCFGSGLSTAFPRSRIFDPESLGRWERDTVREVGAISGAMLLVDRTVWQRLGGFDTAYFMYSEDIDLCARAGEIGCRPIIDPAATAAHEAGASSTPPSKMVMILTGKATYVRRRWRPVARVWGLSMLWLGAAIRAVAGRRAAGARAEVWGAVWVERSSWFAGYAPAAADVEQRCGSR